MFSNSAWKLFILSSKLELLLLLFHFNFFKHCCESLLPRLICNNIYAQLMQSALMILMNAIFLEYITQHHVVASADCENSSKISKSSSYSKSQNQSHFVCNHTLKAKHRPTHSEFLTNETFESNYFISAYRNKRYLHYLQHFLLTIDSTSLPNKY